MNDRIRAEQARADSQRVDKLIGEVLANRYQIELRLGEGAMGSVYRAKHVKVGRPFAVKVLHPRLLTDDKTLQRFEREAELAGRLHHPNVIGVVDVGETNDGLRYMVMDFAEGHDLATLLAEAPMPAERIHTLTHQMLEGLYHAHEAGLIHRDFKPENVIVEKDTHGEEVPRIVDFGIAILREGGDPTSGTGRLTTNGLVLGTPHYMAPEQAVNDPIDHRIDLFALGIMVYEMLCGKLPFDGHGAEVARANLLLDPPAISERVPYLDVDPLLEAFARRMMMKRREQRPPTAKAARELLDLIKNDRRAAAAALGVSLEAARSARSTEPVSPRHASSADFDGTFPPPMQAPSMSNVVAVRAKTPPSGVIVQTQTRTDDVIPLEVEHPSKSNRKMIIAALVGVLIIGGGVVGIVAMTNGDKKPAPEKPPVVAIQDKPVVVETPKQPPPVVDVQTPPVVVDTTVKTTPKPNPKNPKTNPQVKTQVKTQAGSAAPPVVVVETPKPPVITETVKPPVVETAKPKQPTVYDPDAFKAHWQAVGAELKQYASVHGPNSVSDLNQQYSNIIYMVSAATQQSRDVARGKLDAIRGELAKRK